MNSIAERIHTIARRRQRRWRGEAVTLRDSLGDISAEISDGIVTVETPSLVRGDGPVEYTAVLRLDAQHYKTALKSLTAEFRGHKDWNILSVAPVYAGTFRVELSRLDTNHSNQFDLDESQAEWR